jgi:hypothetical protein
MEEIRPGCCPNAYLPEGRGAESLTEIDTDNPEYNLASLTAMREKS